MKPSVLILCGGTSAEREVSLRSGAAVYQALKAAGYTVMQTDYNGTLPAVIKADIVFPVLHGSGGEDGSVQQQLENRAIAYVGSSVVASQLCFDKAVYKDFIGRHGFPTASGDIVNHTTFANHHLRQTPFVLKPHDGGSSVDTYVVRDPQQPMPDLANCFDRHPTMLIEKLITGTEITVAVLKHAALPVIEIIPPANGEFDYENKYNGQTQELCPPISVTPSIQLAAQKLAEQIHQVCDCYDFSRTDMIIDQTGQLHVLETNTIPGMTGQSLLPKAALAGGYDFSQLVDKLIATAWARQQIG